MRRILSVTSAFVVVVGICLLVWGAARHSNADSNSLKPMTDAERIASLLETMETADLASLPALEIEPFTLPTAGVDVMRVRLNETYDIAGIGKDTVELTGWVAVKHDNPIAAKGESEVKWGTAVSATEFVGLELNGTSSLFGPVNVSLDKDNPCIGKVGKLDLPFIVQIALDNGYAPYRAKTVAYAPTASKTAKPQLKGEEGAVSKVIDGVMEALSNKDAKSLVRYYATDVESSILGDAATPGAKGSANYVETMDKEFAGIRRIKVLPNNDIKIKVSGNLASVSLTGTNDMVGVSGVRQVSPWRWSIQLEKRTGNWMIINEHLSFTRDPNEPEELKVGNKKKSSVCVANVAVSVYLPKLDLRMKTGSPVQWYSEVETIPPVGYTASVDMTPTPMVSNGRQVATLESGVVKFREVVRHVALEGTHVGAGL